MRVHSRVSDSLGFLRTSRNFALTVAASALALALFGLPSLSADENVTFTTPVRVSQDSTAGLAYSVLPVYQPQMLTDSEGNVYIAYQDVGATVNVSTLWLVHGTFTGDTFHAASAPVEISASGTSFNMALEGPCIVDIAYVSPSDSLGPNDVLFAQSTDCGATFKSINVTNGGTPGQPFSVLPQVVINGSTAQLVWRSAYYAGSLSWTIFYAQRNSATTFTTPVALASISTLVQCFTAFAVPATGDTDVGWCDDTSNGNEGHVWFLRVGRAAPPTQIGSGIGAHFAFDQAGNVYVSWMGPVGVNQFSRSVGNSGIFTPAQQLFPTQTGLGSAAMVADANGNLNLLMVQQGAGFDNEDNSFETQALLYSRSTDQGGTFANPVSLALYKSSLPGDGAFVSPAMKVHPDGVVDVAWTVPSDWSSTHYPQGLSLSRSTHDATSFSAPVNILNNFTCFSCLQIATDSTDHVLLAWTNSGIFVTQGSALSDFTIAAAPHIQTVLPGGATKFALTLTATGGFSDPVKLSCSKLPAAAECAFDSSSITPTSSGATVNLTVTAPATLAAGNFAFTVSASGSSLTHTQDLQMTVGGISGSVSPSSATIAVGSSSNFDVNLKSTGGFAGQVELVCSGAPSGMACSFNPGQVTLAANGGGSSALTVNVTAQPSTSAAPGARIPPPQSHRWPLSTGVVFAFVALGIVVILIAPWSPKQRFLDRVNVDATNRSSSLRARLLRSAPFAAVLILAIVLISCSGVSKSGTNADTGTTSASGSTGNGSTGTTSGTGTTGTSGSGSGGTSSGSGTAGSGNSGSGSSGGGTGGGSGSSGSGASGGSGGSGSGGSASSVTSQITIQAQSDSAVINLGTVSITVP